MGGAYAGDESYAGSRSFARLQATLQELTGYRHIFPVHQGRAAERILARTVLQPGQVVLNNTHFDTTRANFEQVGAQAIDLPAGASDFNGDMDLVALEAHLQHDPVALVMMTLTNNAVGGHPVSMANLRAVSRLCKQAGVPFFLDAARFAENAWFIHAREPGFGRHTLPDIAREIFDLADGCSISAKKDAMVHIGGVLAAQREDWAELFRRELILGEGYVTYGGLAGRDLETMSVGFQEALDPDYLRYRARSVAYFAEGLEQAGMPTVQPPGGHAVFIDAGQLLPHIPPEQFPGQALAVAFYLEGGVRGVEVGKLMFPAAEVQLLRLALPRRTYTQAHIDYVIEVAGHVVRRKDALTGYTIVEEPPFLRHFSCRLADAKEQVLAKTDTDSAYGNNTSVGSGRAERGMGSRDGAAGPHGKLGLV